MRKLSAAFLIFVAIVAAGILFTRDTGQDAAYAEAEARIAEAIEQGTAVLKLDNIPGLQKLPPSILDVPNVIQLNLRNAQVMDIDMVGDMRGLKILSLRGNRVVDLSPLQSLEKLEILDIGETWVADLSPLVTLPSLKRLDVGDTQLRSLEPATRMATLTWINLHGAYALDGSKSYYDDLKSTGIEVNNGRAFRENYQPGWMQRYKVRFQRVKSRLGFGAR